MGGWDNVAHPFLVCVLLWQIPPTIAEVSWYYLRGGLVPHDEAQRNEHLEHVMTQMYRDYTIYLKRFLDRPKSEASRAFYAYLDWSGTHWDKSIYMHRRNLAKRDGEISRSWRYIYGPFLFNWKAAHNKQWARGDDAAAMMKPYWGNGGEDRARGEFAEASDKCLNKHWHYQIMKKVKKEQAAKQAAAAADAAVGL